MITSDMGTAYGFTTEGVSVLGGNYVVSCPSSVFIPRVDDATFDISNYDGVAAAECASYTCLTDNTTINEITWQYLDPTDEGWYIMDEDA